MADTGTPIKNLQEATSLADTMDIIVETTAPKTQRSKLSTLASWIYSKLGIGSLLSGLSVSGKTITYTKKDGTKGTITTQDTNTTYSNATASTAGLMSASDKSSLDYLKNQVIYEEKNISIASSYTIISKAGYHLVSAHLAYWNTGSAYVEWIDARDMDNYTIWTTGLADGQYAFQLIWIKK